MKSKKPVKLNHYTSAQIKRLRLRHHASQWVFAAYLNLTVTTIKSWENGKHKPSGMALVLLNLIDKHGLSFLAA